MVINFQTSTPISDNSKNYIEEKLQKLETFYDRIEAANVFIHTDDGTNSGGFKEVEVRLAVPGPDLFASDDSATVEQSVGNVVDKLKRQIIKMKDKMNDHKAV